VTLRKEFALMQSVCIRLQQVLKGCQVSWLKAATDSKTICLLILTEQETPFCTAGSHYDRTPVIYA
jgi:hypothetical protein